MSNYAKRMTTLTAIVLSLLLTMLVGCGSPQQASSPSADSASAATEQASSTSAEQASSSPAAQGEASYTERTFTVFSNLDDAPDQLVLRFYDDMPNVPYFGLAQYKEIVFGDKTAVESDGKTATFTATDGGTLTVDDAADTVSSDDLLAFRTYLKPQTKAGKRGGMLDLGTPFVRIRSIESEGEAQPVTLDYGAYDINLHVDKTDAYLPLSCESDLLSDAACAALFTNGTNLYLATSPDFDATTLDPDYFSQLQANHERPQDIADFTYDNLCFLVDNLRGNNKSAALDELVAQKGLNEALAYDEVTRTARDQLQSTDYFTFVTGLQTLDALLFDGHTVLFDNRLEEPPIEDNQDAVSIYYNEYELKSSYLNRSYPDHGVAPILQREEALGKNPEPYRELGNTAVIILDDFMGYDAAGWKAHYDKGADVPDGSETPDVVGTLLAGLKRAKANPDIKNVVLDMSCNGGGYNDLLAALDALVLGTSQLRLRDNLTSQFYNVNYEVDSLFDGSFKTSAFADGTNFNYALLTSHFTFSCGNEFAEHCKDAGIPILGEISSGGECMLTFTHYPEGLQAQISCDFMHMTNAAGDQIESGVPVDVNLVKESADGVPDYSDFYDMERLNEVMNSL